MNRHARRRAASAARKRKAAAPWHVRRQRTRFYDSYVRHLPRAPIDAPVDGNGPLYFARLHDSWCSFFHTGDSSDCDCEPVFVRFTEPTRQ